MLKTNKELKNSGNDIKIIVVGNSSVGKTSFVNKWTKNQFTENYRATIVSEFNYKLFEYNNVMNRIQIWDLAGQDRSVVITRVFCKNSKGAIIISDITKHEELESVLEWKSSIEEIMKKEEMNFPIMLLESKVDLCKDFLATEEEFRQFTLKNNFIGGFRVSAKTGYNVLESMEFIIKNILINNEKETKDDESCLLDRTHFNVNEIDSHSSSTNCC